MTPSYPNELLLSQADLNALLSTTAMWPAGSRPIRGPNSTPHTPHTAQSKRRQLGQLQGQVEAESEVEVGGGGVLAGKVKNLMIETGTDISETENDTASPSKGFRNKIKALNN